MPARAAESGGVDGVRKRVVFKDVGEEGEKGWLKIDPCINQKSDSWSDGSSSIGRNSDDSENSVEEEAGEVQSLLKKCPFDAAMCRRGISRFYNGKSKSFASLAEASSSSTKDLGKPDNAYMRRRRNMTWEKNRSSCLRSNGGSISKRVSKPTSNVAAEQCRSRVVSSWRSVSLVDLQPYVSVAECGDSDLVAKPC